MPGEHEDEYIHGHAGAHGDAHADAQIVDRLPEGAWRIDPDGSELLFKARSLFGLLPVQGLFERFDGWLRVHDDGSASGTLTVEAASIQTGFARRDDDLRGDGFFDVERHPQMQFTLEAIRPGGREHLDLSGTLAVCGRRIPLTLETYAIAHDDHLHLEGRALLDHRAAGLGWARTGRVSKDVRLEAALTLTRE